MRWSLSGTYPFGPAITNGTLLLADFNQDGKTDQLYDTDGASNSSNVFLALGNGDGTFGTPIQKPDNAPFTTGPLAGINFVGASFLLTHPVDINNDGLTDLVVGTSNQVPQVYLGTANGLSPTAITPFPTQGNSGRFTFGDFNGDGRLDVINQVSSSNDGLGITLYLGQANGTFSAIAAPNGGAFTSGPLAGIDLPNVYVSSLLAADLNGDGTDDLIDAYSSSQAKVYLSNGSSLNPTAVTTLFPAQANSGRFLMGDFDSDGDIDVLNQSKTPAGQGIALYLNNGTGTFTKIDKPDDATAGDGSGLFTSGPFQGLSLRLVTTENYRLGDVDNDGDLDLVYASPSFKSYYVQGSGSGGNGAPPRLVSSTPADNSTGFAPSGNIVLTFDEAVTGGTGLIEIRRSSDNVVVASFAGNSAQVTGSGTATITLNPTADLATNTGYYVTFAEKAFVDSDGATFGVLEGNQRNGISSPTFLNFTTGVANTPPALTGTAAVLAGGVENDSYTVTKAQLLQGWSDADNNTLSLNTLSTNHGSIATTDGGLTYTITPDANYDGPVTISYNVSDGTANTAATLAFTLKNVVEGTAGDDVLAGTSGPDIFRGLGADDTVSYANASGAVTVSLLDPAQNTGAAAGDSYDSIESLTGSNANDSLTGNGNANTLDGNGGADTLTGLGGNDSYIVDEAGDQVIETAGNGNADAVYVRGNAAFTSFTLAAGLDIEVLATSRAVSTRPLDLTGNEKDQTLYGNRGVNVLDGKGGADQMIGGDGADTFAFSTALGADNVDRIVDFASEDTIRLAKSVFTALDLGVLSADAFKDLSVSGASVDASDRILYDAKGRLFYDADGVGGEAAVLFARVSYIPTLTHDDFNVA